MPWCGYVLQFRKNGYKRNRNAIVVIFTVRINDLFDDVPFRVDFFRCSGAVFDHGRKTGDVIHTNNVSNVGCVLVCYRYAINDLKAIASIIDISSYRYRVNISFHVVSSLFVVVLNVLSQCSFENFGFTAGLIGHSMSIGKMQFISRFTAEMVGRRQ